MSLGALPADLSAAMVLAVLFLFAVVLAGLCLCYAIAADARARGSNGVAWALFVFLFPPIGAAAYLFYRTRLPARAEPTGGVERWVGAFGIGGTAAGIAAVQFAPPDPFSLGLLGVPLLAVSVPAAAVLCYEPGWRALVTRS